MTIPSEYVLDGDVVGCVLLVALDTTGGTIRFGEGFEGYFTDSNGNVWLGSRLIQVTGTDIAINGTAPGLSLAFSYIQDPDAQEDLVSAIEAEGGVDAIRGRSATFYLQYMEDMSDWHAPSFAPVQWFKRTMINLTYSYDGPQQRTIGVVCEGDWRLRNRPSAGRYTRTDHERRLGESNPSLTVMPNGSVEGQRLSSL